MSATLEKSPFWLPLYPLWQWLVFVPTAVVLTIVGGALAIPIALISPRAANLYVAVSWCRILTRMTPARVDIEGMEHVDPDQSYVVVANHQSQFDIPVIYGYCGLDLRWVMKAELNRIPFVAAGCRAIGHIFIDRADPAQARDAINSAVARLQPGTGILFFAEGTRSRSGKLLPFKKGAFRVAVDQQLPVLPMTVTGTRDVLPAGTLRLRPGRVHLRIHPPVSTAGLKTGDIDALRGQVRDQIASALSTSA
ncbi:lysophospholipid acyltransferase family protein [Wenzhouxiangella limi]|uniref:1-acyl-sn-glycerol-3-phosphate acyltransferase n=1 Tax=Wenzhouxiangella limi TaxID=2707351 RepID=A0A845V321_9GAMM|nr:lysophospholipid acyltransferase family protein [Wenzhouxiangella limi]NDY94661.1 1-acyl-sn-glycerol-3-phosphate acyltransferase [Wenzhouxiangella limi]